MAAAPVFNYEMVKNYLQSERHKVRRSQAGNKTMHPLIIACRIAKGLDSVEPDKCWLWTGALWHNNTGVIVINQVRHSVPRLVYELNNGPIPKELRVRHTCDNSRCINPDHLYTTSEPSETTTLQTSKDTTE